MSGLDLYLSQRALALLLVYGALTGFVLGAFYDGLRVLRMLFGESRLASTAIPPCTEERKGPALAALLFVEDVIFTVTASVAFILLCYYANDGQLRAPAVLGLCGGFFVYRHTVSRPLLRLASTVIRLVKKLLLALGRLVAAPLCRLWSVTVGRLLRQRRERTTEKRIRELAEQAARGFDLLEKTGNPPGKPE